MTAGPGASGTAQSMQGAPARLSTELPSTLKGVPVRVIDYGHPRLSRLNVAGMGARGQMGAGSEGLVQ